MLPQTDRTPLLPALLSFMAGAMAAGGGNWPPTTAFLWLTAILTTSLATLALLRRRPPPASLLRPLPFLLFFLCGLLYTQSFRTPNLPPHHLSHLITEKQEVSLTGKLIEKPTFRHGKTQLILKTDSVLLPFSEGPLATTGRILLTINAPLLKGLVPGQDYLVRARLFLPEKPTTPGVFDYAAHLAAEEIMIKGWVPNPIFIQAISPPAEDRHALPRPYFLERFRQQFESFLYTNLAPDTAALYQALLLGDSSNLTSEVLEVYRATGIMHLLAISGSHLAVVAFLSTLFFRIVLSRFPWLLLRVPAGKIALSCTFPVLFFYAGLAGFHPPVVRALIMIGVFISAILLDRQWSSLNNLAIAAFCILLYNPLSIQTASFQLTFAATAAIILTLPRITAWCPQPARNAYRQRMQHLALSGLFISCAAFLATAPLALYHFNRISLFGPITTLLVTPLLCFWTLPLGLLALMMQQLSPMVAVALLQLGALGIQASHSLTGILAGLPFSSFWLPTPTIPLLILAYALLVLLFRARRPLSVLATLTCFALLLSGYAPRTPWQNNSAHLTFLDVGNGSATVVEQPDNRVILIDGGGPASDLFNVGERVIAPYLWHRQIKRVETIILTHAHADHFNGLPYIIERFQPEVLWLSETNAQEPGYAALLHNAKQAGCQIRIAKANQVLAVGKKGFAITCLNNLALAGEQTAETKTATANPNNRGLVLRLDYGRNTFLFPGDIEKDYEEYILDKGERLKADVLLMPHHGLKSSGSVRLMERISPQYCVVSTGRKYPFPPLQACDSAIEIFSTARQGSVFFLTDGKTITARPYRAVNHFK